MQHNISCVSISEGVSDSELGYMWLVFDGKCICCQQTLTPLVVLGKDCPKSPFTGLNRVKGVGQDNIKIDLSNDDKKLLFLGEGFWFYLLLSRQLAISL